MKTAAIIGYGRMGKAHHRAYRECGVYVLGAYDRVDSEYAYREIKSAPPHYVSVCSWDDSHADYICAALEAGCKVIAEKPLCLTEADLRRIWKLTTPENLTCNLPLLHLSWPVAEAEKAGLLDVYYIWGRADRIKEWRAKCPGYSFVLGAGVHLTSLLLALKGRAIRHVTATGQRSSPDIDCETIIHAHGDFVDGSRFNITIDCSTIEEHRHGVHICERFIPHRDTDKTAEPMRFIREGNSLPHHLFAAHSVCFAIERAIKSGERETVGYLT